MWSTGAGAAMQHVRTRGASPRGASKGVAGSHGPQRARSLALADHAASASPGFGAPAASRTISRRLRATADAAQEEKLTEEAAWKKRAEEAATVSNTSNNGGHEWRWTLNWDQVTPEIIIGSCPRSGDDVSRIAAEAGATAILNLQSDACLDAMAVSAPECRDRALSLGLLWSRVAMRDFDKADQALMLPEAVRMLAGLVASGRRVYVHCTAGINRASLTVVAYLSFMTGLSLEEAEGVVKAARPQAHPYMECGALVRRQMLDGRADTVTHLSRSIYDARCAAGQGGSMQSDWKAAEAQFIASLLSRQVEADMIAQRSITALAGAAAGVAASAAVAEAVAARADLESATTAAAATDYECRRLAAALESSQLEVAAARGEAARLGALAATTAESLAVAQATHAEEMASAVAAAVAARPPPAVDAAARVESHVSGLAEANLAAAHTRVGGGAAGGGGVATELHAQALSLTRDLQQLLASLESGGGGGGGSVVPPSAPRAPTGIA